jgi:ribosomal protein L11 methyltransferase
MPWLKISLRTLQEYSEALETLLLDEGAVSVSYADAEDNPVLEPAPGETPIWPDLILSALFDADTDIEQIRMTLQNCTLPHSELHTELLPDQDWERAWMDDFKPMRFGERLWICPSWLEPPEPDAVNLMLDPGQAFGTGTHPTTALCLEWLDAHPPKDELVIDYGCGSGILAVAALKLGARHCWGIDIDPQALEATRANADKNGIPEAHLYVVQPEGLPPIKADLLIANILSGPLVELAPALSNLVKPEGKLILSGILEDQADNVITAYSPWFEMQQPVGKEEWIRLEGKRLRDA